MLVFSSGPEPLDSIALRLSGFATKIFQLRAKIIQKRNMHAHISRLPPELLVEIFSYCRRARKRADGSLDESRADIALLPAQICRGWRLIALNAPQLWSNIEIAHQSELPSLPILLSRTAQIPIRLAYDDIQSLNTLASSLIQAHIHHTAALSLHLADEVVMAGYLAALDSPCPQLRELRLSTNRVDNPDREILVPESLVANVSTLILDTLGRVIIPPNAQFVRLTVKCGVGATQLSALISHTPSLQHLTLLTPCADTFSDPLPRHLIEHLKSLIITQSTSRNCIADLVARCNTSAIALVAIYIFPGLDNVQRRAVDATLALLRQLKSSVEYTMTCSVKRLLETDHGYECRVRGVSDGTIRNIWTQVELSGFNQLLRLTAARMTKLRTDSTILSILGELSAEPAPQAAFSLLSLLVIQVPYKNPLAKLLALPANAWIICPRLSELRIHAMSPLREARRQRMGQRSPKVHRSLLLDAQDVLRAVEKILHRPPLDNPIERISVRNITLYCERDWDESELRSWFNEVPPIRVRVGSFWHNLRSFRAYDSTDERGPGSKYTFC